ncbi:hypothetical protein [Shewanella fidelis]|uniref:Uncharacterized protein n=1 Tax=Shewanella fidelis TaxID=173509 RepID=A0AAW8NRN9_9GAMM|nr:hypothetical protein [Shewanella fidelis]MDR8525216.1 hypothetical protein [Shewanella fidelis]MDW4811287.1 hypothetical protein [Shewanella fidelis]MDW4814934.1 hypothetical protein [Shewanella fidelis]MDW4819024.1 hypothetical protein [Shewanella fidelis]MDW4823299.1 hypothetical protein [Shewanella fidelis]
MSGLDKSQLIELLEYPRRRILQSMELRYCPHAGFYNPTDMKCINCHQGMECTWMNHNDETIAVERKTVEDLKQQLLVAVDFIDSSLTPHHLSRRNCECENCIWLRKVQQALNI